MNFSAVLTEIASLSVDERICLVKAIWDSISLESKQFEVAEAQKQELALRLAAHNASPSNIISWEEVKAQALARVNIEQ